MTGKEALDWLKRVNMKQNNGKGDLWLEMNIDAIEKDLKALEIIKRKDICPTKLYNAKDYESYLWTCEQEQIDKEWILTQKEYDLLNEVFFE